MKVKWYLNKYIYIYIYSSINCCIIIIAAMENKSSQGFFVSNFIDLWQKSNCLFKSFNKLELANSCFF